MNFRHDLDPKFYDEYGYMWSKWLLRHYIELNEKAVRSESDNEKIDLIYNASFAGREALKRVEKFLKSMKQRKID